jgi:hypothetical protein
MATRVQISSEPLPFGWPWRNLHTVTSKRLQSIRLAIGYGSLLLLIIFGVVVANIMWDSDPASALVLFVTLIAGGGLLIWKRLQVKPQ